MTTKTREPYYATTLFENNAPNTPVVLKRATPGANRFNGEVIARCQDEATARLIASLLNTTPELLAASKVLSGWVERVAEEVTMGPDDQRALNLMRAAISRAEDY